jgi:class 3 adenylate cyclase
MCHIRPRSGQPVARYAVPRGVALGRVPSMCNVAACLMWHSAGVSADPAAAAPSGVVTFLFTDVEGSTRRWEADAQAMRAALVVHDKVLRTAIEAYDGFLFSHTGDAMSTISSTGGRIAAPG